MKDETLLSQRIMGSHCYCAVNLILSVMFGYLASPAGSEQYSSQEILGVGMNGT